MKKSSIIISLTLGCTGMILANCNSSSANTVESITPNTISVQKVGDQKIQVALLLDTSNSMDGLINQAKSRLWNIVNTLTTLRYDGKAPTIEIALYEYGNDGLSSQSNYIRQVTPFTTDLDLLSEKLFSLRTNGGSEYCGAVIQEAYKKLDWDSDNNSMRLIYIAGNEPFDQGGVNYKESIADARKKDIYINTIFCGNKQEGITTFWKDGADIGKGKYFNIDSNATIDYIVTPYDEKINTCNDKLNSTYIGYGREGEYKKMNQSTQDNNAKIISSANVTERAISKSKKEVYNNESWDLVDKVNKDAKALDGIKDEELPKELQNKSKAEIEQYVEQKTKEREEIQKEIGELAQKRQMYIEQEMKKKDTQDDLGNAITESIKEFAQNKGYTIEKL